MRTSATRVCMGALVTALLVLPTALALVPNAEAGDGALVRPISDFLSQQTLPGDLVDWVSDDSQTDPSYRARVDFIGVIHEGFVKPNGGDFGTTFSGTVTERVRADGRTEVHIVLHGRNVFYFVGTAPYFSPILSGRLAGASFAGLTVDTCTTRYDLTYITTNAPGEPMPRLVPLLFNTPEGWEILQSKLVAEGDCELRAAFGVPDGTPGHFSLNMNGLIHPKGGDVSTDDTYAVGAIRLREVGN